MYTEAELLKFAGETAHFFAKIKPEQYNDTLVMPSEVKSIETIVIFTPQCPNSGRVTVKKEQIEINPAKLTIDGIPCLHITVMFLVIWLMLKEPELSDTDTDAAVYNFLLENYSGVTMHFLALQTELPILIFTDHIPSNKERVKQLNEYAINFLPKPTTE